MLGPVLQFEGFRGEDQFYIPVRPRKSQNQHKQVRKADNEEKGYPDSTAKTKFVVSSDNKNSKEPSKWSTLPSSPSQVPISNISRFLKSTRPFVPAQYFSKTTMRGRRTCDVEYQSYFTLHDLWESFKEWSVYGAGVPLILEKSESVVQYYVPYLSGVQLYGKSTEKSDPKLRQTSDNSGGDYYSSEGSSRCELGKSAKLSEAQCRQRHLISDVPSRLSRLSLNGECKAMQEGSSSDDGEAGNSQGHLLFEFFDQEPPYSREPLADKILDLACQYPGLKVLRSCDLLPASWMSVAWYPIYRIPTGPTLKDLDACFLMYYKLSTSATGSGDSQAPVLVYPGEMDSVPKFCLPTFGMASYKLKGSIWLQNGASDNQLTNSLCEGAENWLKLQKVNHPDYQFFTSHSTCHR